jgi:hypothetical protein
MLLAAWDDLFKASKELLEDDYNQGQQLAAKVTSRALDSRTVSALPEEFINVAISSVVQTGGASRGGLIKAHSDHCS